MASKRPTTANTYPVTPDHPHSLRQSDAAKAETRKHNYVKSTTRGISVDKKAVGRLN